MTTKTYIGDTGTVIELDTGVSLVGATEVSIEAQKPDGALASWTGAAAGTQISYTSLAGTFDQAGAWLLQARAVLPSGAWRGETAKLMVYAPFS
jgi:hypothetical protein